MESHENKRDPNTAYSFREMIILRNLTFIMSRKNCFGHGLPSRFNRQHIIQTKQGGKQLTRSIGLN